MAASITGVSQNTGGAAATATCLLTFAQTAGDIIEAFIRGSANASATVANIYDDAGGTWSSTGTPTSTVIQFTGASWTVNQFAGCVLTCTDASNGSLFRISRPIASNTSNTVTLSSALPATPSSGESFVIGNAWSALGTWTADGGAATSHAQFLHATNVLAASGSAVTLTVVWGGGNTGFTLGCVGITGAATGATPEVVGTVAAGTGTAPIAGSVTSAVGGVLLGGFSTVTTAQTYSSGLDNAAGSALTQQVPASGTYRVFVGSRLESAGTYAPRVTQSASEGWVAAAIFVPDPGAAVQDTPELYGRPSGVRGQNQMHQLLAT